MLDQGDNEWSGGRCSPAEATLVRLTSSQNSVPEGEAIDLTAFVQAVDGASPGMPIVGGMVTFRDGAQLLGGVPLDEAGMAQLSGLRLTPGVHAVTASYAGDAAHAAATSAPFPQSVVAAAERVSVAVAAPTATPDGVLLEAELLDPRSGRLLEQTRGTVTFSVRIGGETSGEKRAVTVAVRGGQAQTLVELFPEGQVIVDFSGDAEHAPARGCYGQEAVGT